jgi:hypothetical protein
MADQPSGLPNIGPLYTTITTPNGLPGNGVNNLKGARDIFGNLSVSSQFKVSLHLNNSQGQDSNLLGWLASAGLTLDPTSNTYYDFFCAEAALPGATFDMAEEVGSRQGVIERFPTRRIYPDFTMTFYVDNDYRILRLFEEWMNYINPVYDDSGLLNTSSSGQGNAKGSQNFFRFRYPEKYKRIISITKFERNFRVGLNKVGFPPLLTYRMIDAFPTNITAIPVSYEGSTITKSTITFNYTRYVTEKSGGNLNLFTYS